MVLSYSWNRNMLQLSSFWGWVLPTLIWSDDKVFGVLVDLLFEGFKRVWLWWVFRAKFSKLPHLVNVLAWGNSLKPYINKILFTDIILIFNYKELLPCCILDVGEETFVVEYFPSQVSVHCLEHWKLENLGPGEQPYLQGVWKTELSDSEGFLGGDCLNFLCTWHIYWNVLEEKIQAEGSVLLCTVA